MISTRNLTRTFKQTRAVDGVTLDIQRGELFGLIGPDGAGKTTLLRLLAGLLDISAGEAQVAGFDLKTQAEAAKAHIGYMAQRFSLYAQLSVVENLTFFAEIYDVPPSERQARMERLLQFAALSDFRHRRAAHLSGGMQKKLALACSLIHQPEILLLDEPTTGVDPISRREFWDILTELHTQGSTIIISTPYMDEADRCSRVGLMYQGRLIACDTPQALRNSLGAEVIEILPSDWRAARHLLTTLEGVREVQTYGEALHILVDNAAERMPQIAEALEARNIAYRGLRRTTPRMEQTFISMIRRLESENTTT